MVCPLNNRACRCDPADAKLRPCMLAKRVAKLIRSQASLEEEALNATRALRRLLPAEGLSFNDIAILVENCDCKIEALQYSENDVAGSFAHGVEKGRAENHGRAFSADYFNENGEPRWAEIVKFCDSNPAKTSLKPNEQEFLDEMPAKLRWRCRAG